MFKQQYFLKGINTFTAFKDSVLFKNNSDELFFGDLRIDTNVRSYYNCNGNILFFKDKFTNVYSLQYEKVIDRVSGSLFFGTYNNENVILVEKIDSKRLISKINFDCDNFGTRKEIGHFDIENYFRDTNENLYFNTNFQLQSLLLSTGVLNWQIILSHFGEIRKILGVKEEKLWVSIYRGGINKDKNILLALDIVTGEVVYQSPSEYDLSDWFVELIPEQNAILSIYGKISTHQADSPLIEINATTGAVIRNQRIESLYLENLKIGFWKVLDNKIYFTANKDTLHGRYIGILDYNTLEILWQTEINDLRGTLKDFQATDNKIYALDTGNQLHIFEKE